MVVKNLNYVKRILISTLHFKLDIWVITCSSQGGLARSSATFPRILQNGKAGQKRWQPVATIKNQDCVAVVSLCVTFQFCSISRGSLLDESVYTCLHLFTSIYSIASILRENRKAVYCRILSLFSFIDLSAGIVAISKPENQNASKKEDKMQ